MKCATYILLFLFVGFTIIPTVVTLFSNESNNIELYDIIEQLTRQFHDKMTANNTTNNTTNNTIKQFNK